MSRPMKEGPRYAVLYGASQLEPGTILEIIEGQAHLDGEPVGRLSPAFGTDLEEQQATVVGSGRISAIVMLEPKD